MNNLNLSILLYETYAEFLTMATTLFYAVSKIVQSLVCIISKNLAYLCLFIGVQRLAYPLNSNKQDRSIFSANVDLTIFEQ